MQFSVLASDYDETLAEHGTVTPSTLDALHRLRSSGRRFVLVTGRTLPELLPVFPQLELCDAVVAENGALLYQPASRQRRPLGTPPPREFVSHLEQRGVSPLIRGEVLLATRVPHDVQVLEAIRAFGLELQLIFNKGAVMLLPPGINKASGLAAALGELHLSPRNAVGMGDGENDHALLASCGWGVAVAGAVPMLQRAANWVTRGGPGQGVVEVIDQLLDDDLARWTGNPRDP